MKIAYGIGSCLLSVLLLTGCGINPVDKSAKTSQKSHVSQQHDKRLASLKAENKALKQQTSQTTSSQSVDKQQASRTTSQSESSQTAATAEQVTTLTDTQKLTITTQFLAWASSRAATGNMAVSDYYFNHGSGGLGDWYANTPDGQVQVQDNHQPGATAFNLHAIGGVVFYTAKDGQVGIDSTLKSGTTAQGYSINMDFDQPASKYLLADNGVVYEVALGKGTSVSPADGFGEFADNGGAGSNAPTSTFIISKDSAAQTELAELIRNTKGE